MYVVVYLYGHALAVAFSRTEATHQNDLVLKSVLFDGLSQKIYYVLGSLEMAGASHTDLYYQHRFALVSISSLKKSPTVSGETENTVSSMLTQTPL